MILEQSVLRENQRDGGGMIGKSCLKNSNLLYAVQYKISVCVCGCLSTSVCIPFNNWLWVVAFIDLLHLRSEIEHQEFFITATGTFNLGLRLSVHFTFTSLFIYLKHCS